MVKTKQVTKRNYIYSFLILLFLIVSYALTCTLSPEKANVLAGEDNLIETFSAVCYFFSACILFYLFFRSKSFKRKYLWGTDRNYFFLFLGLLFFVSLGEEISWGQRIFNIETPEWLGEINKQQETNFHNLYFLQPEVDAENPKSMLVRWFNIDRVYTLFWLFYCVLIPILNKYSPKAQNILRKIHLPIVPIWIAYFFLLNFILQNVIEIIYLPNYPTELSEFYENNTAFLFLVVSITFLSIGNSNSKTLVE
ncbi:MAG TPA: hypothetical protein DDW27_06025 [Bacteroidales bacterium]|nr:hypothetical protein [Bacteroidales bacterium]